MSVSVCPLEYLERHTAELHQILCARCLSPCLVLLWRRFAKLCTSGFADDFTPSHGGLYGASCDESDESLTAETSLQATAVADPAAAWQYNAHQFKADSTAA